MQFLLMQFIQTMTTVVLNFFINKKNWELSQ